MPRDLWRRCGESFISAPGWPAACAVLAIVFAFAVGWPAFYAIVEVVRGVTWGSSSGGRAFFGSETLLMLVRTLVAAGVVSGVAVAVACPIAWALRSRRSLVPFIVLPMFLPSYVAYAGWGVLRAPQSMLGRWIVAGTPEQSDFKAGLAYDIQAVLGLSLWAWPIAAIIIAAGLSRLSPAVLDALRLEAIPPWRRRLELVSMSRVAIAWAFGVVFVLMLGSAVPFHVAQLETYAIAIWRMVDLTPPEDRWRVWVAALPLVALTIATGGMLIRKSFSISDDAPADDRVSPRPGRSHQNGAVYAHFGAVWVVSVVVPAALLSTSLHDVSSLFRFFRENWGKISDSLLTAFLVACMAWIISVSIWFVARRSPLGRFTAKTCVVLSVCIAPIPGLLVGLATSRAWNAVPAFGFVADTSIIVILVHTARFAFIPVLVGWWLAHSENRSLFDLSRVDGAETGLGWFRACFRSNAWPSVAAAAGVAMLSFQEIEASIMVVPAGYGSMSQWMLQQLHYLREDDLAAGVLFMLVPAIGAAVIASWVLGRIQRRENLDVVSSDCGT